MLYDVLPPLIFFASLGGVILVVSRVVLRIRRVQFTSSVQATLHRARASHAANTEEIARIVGPSTKSVRVIKNRIALMSHTVRDTKTRLREAVQQRRAARTARRHTKSEVASDSTVAPPKSGVIASRVRGLGKGTRRAVADKITSMRHMTERRQEARRQAKEAGTAEPVREPSRRPKPKLAMVKNTSVAAGDHTTTATQPVATRNRLFTKKKEAPPLRQAREAIDAANHEQAERILVPYLAEHPKETRAYMLLGEAALAKHAWGEAMEVFEQVVDLSPQTKGGYAALGRAAFEAGKFTRAIEALQRAHSDDPTDITVINQLLKIARRMDNVPMQHSLMEELSEIKKTRKQSQPRQSTPVQ